MLTERASAVGLSVTVDSWIAKSASNTAKLGNMVRMTARDSDVEVIKHLLVPIELKINLRPLSIKLILLIVGAQLGTQKLN